MKKYLILFSLLFIATVVCAQTYPKTEGIIRILTYNSHYCKGGTDPGQISELNTKLFASVIGALEADVVAIQELDSATTERGNRDLLGQIAQFSGLSYKPIFGKAAAWGGGYIGCGALVSKDIPVEKVKIIPLPGSSEGRVAVRVDMDKFSFISTHGDLGDNERLTGAIKICDELDFIRKPVFLAGDLNDSHTWNSQVFKTYLEYFDIASDITGSTLTDAKYEDNTKGLIDYVLFRDYKNSGFEIVDTHIVRSLEINGNVYDLKIVSDHYPVFVDVRIPGMGSVESAEISEAHCYVSNGSLVISAQEKLENVTVYSLTGQVCLQNNNPESNVFDISDLESGCYLVRFVVDGQVKTQKILLG